MRKRWLFVVFGYDYGIERNEMESWAFELRVEAVRAVLAFADGDGGLSLVHVDSHEVVVVVELAFF